MAIQKGIIPIQGTLGNLTFFKSQDGYMVKTKSAVPKERITTDPAFARTRENNAEFGKACKAGKQFRLAFRGSIIKTKDNRMVSRLSAQMLIVVQADATSERGMRNVIDGEVDFLTGFEFNGNAKLSSTLFAPFTASFDRASGTFEIQVPDFIPADKVISPSGTTHFQLFAAVASIDFENEVYEEAPAVSGAISYDRKNTQTITLTGSISGNSKHPVFVILGIEFMQQVNGKLYSLKNGAYNACSVVKVDSPV